MTDLRDLIARLETVDGPNFRIEQEIMWAVMDIPEQHRSDHDKPPAYTASLDAALKLLPPGFWWRGGTCCVSSEAIVCPDHNHPDHRERLLREYPPTVEVWNSGIEVTIWPGSPDALARALAAACLRVRAVARDLAE